MHTLKTSMLVTASLLLASVHTHAADTAQCEPQPLNARTDFPVKSQLNGEYGVVRLSVVVNERGRAADIALLQSSGHRALDRAAEKSVREYWEFDTRHCASADLAKSRTVDVVFRRANVRTLAGSFSANAAEKSRLMAADTRCHESADATGTAVFACVNSSIANVARAADSSSVASSHSNRSLK